MTCRHLIVFTVTLHIALVAWCGWVHSPTVGEAAYLPAGLSHWHLGNFHQARVTPPLTRLVASLPLLWLEPYCDWSLVSGAPGARSEIDGAQRFIQLNQDRCRLIFAVARWACIPFSLLGAWVSFEWARDLYGKTAGLAALVMWCFSPSVLAHGACVTPDIGAASTGALAGYFFWKWLMNHNAARLTSAGVTLGIAELSRSTWIILFPVLLVIWAFYRVSNRCSLTSRRPLLADLLNLVVMFLIALFVLNLGYGFSGSGRPLGEFEFVSHALNGGVELGNRFSTSWLAPIPIPLPQDYILGIDSQKLDFESWSYPSYCGGTVASKGWPSYYVYGLLLKLPTPHLILILMSGYRAVTGSATAEVRIAQFTCWMVILTVLLLVSSQFGFSAHIRYCYGILPFLCVITGNVTRFWFPCRNCLSRIVTFLLAWYVSSSVFQFPHSMSYFNEIAGGPNSGYKHLVDSNLDWGQDFWYLLDWAINHPDSRPIYVDCYGWHETLMPPNLFSRPHRDSSGIIELRDGWYAISATNLQLSPGMNDYFQDRKPVDRIGYSIFVYRVSARDRININFAPTVE